jgi:hypothetical protein
MNDSSPDESRSLALLAKVLPHMFARWRDPEDFELLSELPDGEIAIDVLTGIARHLEGGPIPLNVARELRAGLEDQLDRRGIAKASLLEAGLIVAFDTTGVKTDRKRMVHFDFRIASRLRTGTETFEASQEEAHVWHERAAGPSP